VAVDRREQHVAARVKNRLGAVAVVVVHIQDRDLFVALFKIAMRILNDYDNQRAAGIKTPVFDSSQFPDLDLDRKAWPANPVKPEAATSAELNAQVQR
jgi:hypothetical protein